MINEYWSGKNVKKAFTWKNEGKPWKNTYKINGFRTHIWTQDIRNTKKKSLELRLDQRQVLIVHINEQNTSVIKCGKVKCHVRTVLYQYRPHSLDSCLRHRTDISEQRFSCTGLLKYSYKCSIVNCSILTMTSRQSYYNMFLFAAIGFWQICLYVFRFPGWTW